MGETDDGARCPEHFDEVFPPRCAHCDALRGDTVLDEWDETGLTEGDAFPLAG